MALTVAPAEPVTWPVTPPVTRNSESARATACSSWPVASARVWSTVGAIGRLADKGTSPARVAAVVSSGVMARAGAMTMVAPRPRTETVCPLVIATESFGSIGLDTITGVLTWTAVTSVWRTPLTRRVSTTTKLPRIPTIAFGVRTSTTSPGRTRLLARLRASFPSWTPTMCRLGSSVTVSTERSRTVTRALPPNRMRTIDRSPVPIRSRTKISSLNFNDAG